MRHLRFALLLSLIASPAWAQNQSSVPRAITLPDTMGANFSIADSATATSAPTDYDFLVGVWHFEFQSRRQNGTFSPPFDGLWFFEKKNTGGNGVLIEDHWRPNDPSQTYEAGTWTYRAYNPQRKLWEMQGINTYVGAWQPGLMWSDGDSRVLIERYGPMLVRFRYFAIQPDHFLWRADASWDNGKTWLRDWWTMEAGRISR